MDVNSKSLSSQAAIAAQARAKAEAEKQTRQVERDAMIRMENARKRAEEVETEMDHRMDHARQATETSVDTANLKREQLVGSLKNQTYKEVADLKRRTAAEVARVRQEGERSTEDLRDFYKSQSEAAEFDGQKRFRESTNRNAILQEYQNRAADDERKILQQSHQEEMEALRDHTATTQQELIRQSEEELNLAREKAASARKDAENYFEGSYSRTIKTNAEALNRASADAKAQLDRLRADHALKLQKYDDRLEDPFYRMVDLGTDLRDHGDYFVLKARIPEHERENVRVTVRGNDLVVTGTRRNEEKLNLGEGKGRTVSSFQTYQEVIPLGSPVEPQGLLREFDSHGLVVTIPKKGGSRDPIAHPSKPATPAASTPSRPTRPDFPEGLAGLVPERPDRPLGRS